MPDNNRISHISGSMCSMYYAAQTNNLQNRFIKMKDQYYHKEHQEHSFMEQSFHTQIQISSITAWILLFFSVLLSAFVSCWLLADVKSEYFTRSSWRFFIVSVLLIPFLLYQQRNLKNQNEKFIKQLTPQKLKPIFIGSIHFCIWLLCLIYACRFTSWNHAVCLSYLRFFLLSAIKIFKKQTVHQLQIAGCILCSIGVLLVSSDSLFVSLKFGPDVQPYERTQPWKRFIFGDGLAIVGSFVSVYLDQHFKIPQMPRFTYLYLYNLALALNLVTSGYFFGGSDFSFDPKFGIFGLFTYENFVSIFYISVMLGFNLMVANILISQIFNDVIINAASRFQLIISSMTWHVLGLQAIPANMTCLGYAFITPGLIFSIGGQGALLNKENKLNFQLYRPTQIRNTHIQDSPGQMHSFSQQTERHFDSSFTKPKQKILQKKPFEMILEEDQNDIKNNKNQ